MSLCGRDTLDPIAEIPLLSIISSCYVANEAKPDGVTGTVFG
jgi:hypothetical protein